MRRRPVLIDTDMGVDDALAMVFALHSKELSVEAVTTVAGNVPVEECTANVRFVMDLLRPSSVPVTAEGSKRPLARTLVSAPEVHGSDGLGGARGKTDRSRKSTPNAVDVILDACDRFGKSLTIVAIGPLTNCALALRKDRKCFRKAGRIVSMGGAFGVPGNTGPVAEFNYFVDPEAVAEVLASGVPMTIVPLDVTEQCRVLRSDLVHWSRAHPSRVSRFLLRMTRGYMRYHLETEGFNGGYLHDPLAVAAAAIPGLVRTVPARVTIDVGKTALRGMTTMKAEGNGNPVRVAISVDVKRFLAMFRARVVG